MKINNINSIYFKKLVSHDVKVQQEHGIHFTPARCVTILTQLSPMDIFLKKTSVDDNPVRINNSMVTLFSQNIQQGEDITIITDEKYPKKLLQAILNCFSAKSKEDCRLIHKDFMDNNTVNVDGTIKLIED